MLLPLPPLSRFCRICSEWSVLEMPHSLHLVQQCMLPEETTFQNLATNFQLNSNLILNLNLCFNTEATKTKY